MLSARYGATATTLESALADPAVAGVIVASPTDQHLAHCLQAAAAGKAIFCEKPVDLSAERARSAAAALGRARLFLGFNRRFDPNFRALRQKLQAGDDRQPRDAAHHQPRSGAAAGQLHQGERRPLQGHDHPRLRCRALAARGAGRGGLCHGRLPGGSRDRRRGRHRHREGAVAHRLGADRAHQQQPPQRLWLRPADRGFGSAGSRARRQPDGHHRVGLGRGRAPAGRRSRISFSSATPRRTGWRWTTSPPCCAARSPRSASTDGVHALELAEAAGHSHATGRPVALSGGA